jgi:hypothetical protein
MKLSTLNWVNVAIDNDNEIGQGVAKNETEALKWYQRAVEAGSDYTKPAIGLLPSFVLLYDFIPVS